MTRGLVLRFTVLVLAGAILLALPISTTQTGSAGIVDAVFSATSAVCGGLTVLDTSTDFTLFGQIVILLLIQLGGLGIMLWSTALIGLFGVKLGLRERLLISEEDSGFSLADTKELVKAVFAFTLISECVGCLALYFLAGETLFQSLFHSISAFCNAGFSLYPDNMMGYQQNATALSILMILMLLGGIGFLTVRELVAKRKGHRLSLQSKLVLTATVALVLLGTFGFWLFEHTNDATLGSQSLTNQLLNSLFASISARTTGFNTIDLSLAEEGTLLMTIILMGIGGAPGSAAGGIKLTTAAILIIAAVSELRTPGSSSVWGRRLPTARVLQGLSLLVFFSAAVVGLSLLLHYLEPFAFRQVLFESASALSTTGLSTGITAELSSISKLLVAAAMFCGRVGPLTLALALIRKKDDHSGVSYPSEEVAIG